MQKWRLRGIKYQLLTCTFVISLSFYEVFVPGFLFYLPSSYHYGEYLIVLFTNTLFFNYREADNSPEKILKLDEAGSKVQCQTVYFCLELNLAPHVSDLNYEHYLNKAPRSTLGKALTPKTAT